MLRTTLAKAYLKRTIRPLYGWTQTTPKSCFLDPAWDRSSPIWPGMAMMKTAGENYTLLNGTGVPAGLCGLYVGGDGIDEVLEAGINALAVWVLSDDAEFEILAPAFDTSVAWTDPGNGTELLIHARTANAGGATATTGLRGQLVPAGTAGASAEPVARLMKVNSATKITIGGLTPRP
jgi:hypothetical protein